METKILKIIAHSIFSSYRTYEEWKRGLPTWFQLSIKRFLPYLWGMETLSVSNILLYRVDRSYRTYEEWKPISKNRTVCGSVMFLPYLWGMETADGRTQHPGSGQSSYRTYEEWKPWSFWNYTTAKHKVLTVPMRNGNLRMAGKEYTCTFVLTVPMRNGNLHSFSRDS